MNLRAQAVELVHQIVRRLLDGKGVALLEAKLTGLRQAPFRAVLTLANALLTSVSASSTAAAQSEPQQLRPLPVITAPTVNSTVAGGAGGFSPPQPASSMPPKSAAPETCMRITSSASAADAIS